MVRKILKGIETIDQKDRKLTLSKLKFSMNAYERLKENEIKKLSESAQDLFHLIHSFRKNEELANFVNVCKCLKTLYRCQKTVTCAPFQIYFYENLFFPDKNSKIESYKKFTNNAIKKLLSQRFTLDQERNEQLINEYIRQKQIKMTWPQWLTWANHQSWFIQNWWLWTGSAFVGKNNRDKRQRDEAFFSKG